MIRAMFQAIVHSLRFNVAMRCAVVALALLPADLYGLVHSGARDVSITHGPTNQRMVALTFDDGINGAYTGEVASILDRRGAHGTFFVVGETLETQGPTARDLVAHGHLLANHSYDHPRPSKKDIFYLQVWWAQRAFEQAIGKCPSFFRPPYGTQTPYVNAAVHRAGMQTILWNVEVVDWREQDPVRLASLVLAKTQPGSIILLHDGTDGVPGADRSVLIDALPLILDGLQERGLSPVTVAELLGVPGYLDECR